MTIKLEEMLNEVTYEDKILTDKDIETSGTITASNISTLTTGSAAGFTVNGDLAVTGAATVKGTLTVTGAITAGAGVTATGNVVAGKYFIGTATGPQIIFGSVTGGAAPTDTAPTGSLFINTSGTGPASRVFVNATGATLWVPITTSA